jgi:hypothetical protein
MIPARPREPALPSAILASLLETTLENGGAARMLLQAALYEAGRSSLPEDPRALLAFSRAHLTGPLREELGPRVAEAVLDDLARQLGAASSPRLQTAARVPASATVPVAAARRPTVVVIDPDRLSRAGLARALVTAACDVIGVSGAAEIDEIDVVFDTALVDVRTPDLAAIIEALRAKDPRIQVIALADDVTAAEGILAANRLVGARALPRACRPAEIAAFVRGVALAR